MSVSLSGITESSTHLSGNKIKVVGTTTGAPVGSTDYKILLKVESLDGELVGGPFIDGIAPNSINQAEFDISGIVDHGIQKTISWPLVGFGNPHPLMVYNILLHPGESYVDSNGDLQESFAGTTIGVFIVKGKLQEWKLSELNNASKTWSEYFCDEKRFMTYMPSTQTVSPYQPVKLWWKTNAVSEALTGTIVATFSDGTTQTANTSFTAYRGLILEFDIHLQHNGINPDNGTKKVISYTFTIGGETFTFNVDWKPYDYYYYVFADNQLGGIDCIWLKGRMKYAPDGERTLAYKPREYGAGVKTASQIVSSSKLSRKWIINSGFKQDEMIYLDILLNAPNAWLLLPPRDGVIGWKNANYELVPVTITAGNLQLHDDMNYGMDNVDIELTEAH